MLDARSRCCSLYRTWLLQREIKSVLALHQAIFVNPVILCGVEESAVVPVRSERPIAKMQIPRG
jgi:hypothetical protein